MPIPEKSSVIVTQNAISVQLPQPKIKRRLKRAVPEPLNQYPLKIKRLPDALQWWEEVRYWLIHEASNLRVPGNFSISEAQYIREISKDWDWSVGSRERKGGEV